MRSLLVITRDARDHLSAMQIAIGDLATYRDVVWRLRDEKQGAVGAASKSTGPCERTMGYAAPEEARVRVENLPKHLRSVSK